MGLFQVFQHHLHIWRCEGESLHQANVGERKQLNALSVSILIDKLSNINWSAIPEKRIYGDINNIHQLEKDLIINLIM